MVNGADAEGARLTHIALARKRAGELAEAQELYELSIKIRGQSDARFLACYGLAKVLFLRRDWEYSAACYMVATELAFNGHGDVDATLNNLGHTILAWSLDESCPYPLHSLVNTDVIHQSDIEAHLGFYWNALRGLGSNECFPRISLDLALRPLVTTEISSLVDVESLLPFLEPGVTIALGLYHYKKAHKPIQNVKDLDLYLSGRLTAVPRFGSTDYHRAIVRLRAEQ